MLVMLLPATDGCHWWVLGGGMVGSGTASALPSLNLPCPKSASSILVGVLLNQRCDVLQEGDPRKRPSAMEVVHCLLTIPP